MSPVSDYAAVQVSYLLSTLLQSPPSAESNVTQAHWYGLVIEDGSTTYNWTEARDVCRGNNLELHVATDSDFTQIIDLLTPHAHKATKDLVVWSGTCDTSGNYCGAWAISRFGMSRYVHLRNVGIRDLTSHVLCTQGKECCENYMTYLNFYH